jgi:hypothetical protein
MNECSRGETILWRYLFGSAAIEQRSDDEMFSFDPLRLFE